MLREFEDLRKLRLPEVVYDEEATLREYEEAQDLFGDILNVTLKGITRVHFSMMYQFTEWRGLDNLLVDFCLNPQFVHEAMSLLEEANAQIIKQYEAMSLLSLNNDGTYHASGGVGYSRGVPGPDFDPNHVRPCDMWASSESQELTSISPEMHAEFALQYERRLLEPFGLSGYGCCENLTDKLDYIFQIGNLRRISVSPWADVRKCAEKVRDRCVFSWKAHPSHLVGTFDPEFIRGYLKEGLDAARDCVVEVILKDTHTVEGHLERFTRWAELAQQAAKTV